MVFVLIVVILNFLVGIFKIFFQLLHPLRYDPEDCIRFHKEDTIFYFLLCVKQCILRDLTANRVFCVAFHFLSVNKVFVSWFIVYLLAANL